MVGKSAAQKVEMMAVLKDENWVGHLVELLAAHLVERKVAPWVAQLVDMRVEY